jgi:hypothetical protein
MVGFCAKKGKIHIFQKKIQNLTFWPKKYLNFFLQQKIKIYLKLFYILFFERNSSLFFTIFLYFRWPALTLIGLIWKWIEGNKERKCCFNDQFRHIFYLFSIVLLSIYLRLLFFLIKQNILSAKSFFMLNGSL